MEDMDIHTLKGMPWDKERKKCNKEETSVVKYVVVKTKYTTYLKSKQNVMEFGLELE
jgi:hypothetical protein